jgi:Tfp pilus assembly protein PilX
MKTPRTHRPTPRGFALIVTLSLMILLTVITVGLLSLSVISLRSSSRGVAQAEARANARLALLLALGELQKYAGLDQRVTANADIAGAAAGAALAAGAPPLNDKSINNISKRLSAVQPGTRYWTGVFANQDAPNTIFTKTPSPINIQWLVSGSNSTYTPGNLTGGPGILPSDFAYAVGAGGSVADAARAVVLVGSNTVGSASGSTDRYVVAPLVGVFENNQPKPRGRYAWWVGDEGVKARMNLNKTFDDPTQYASLSAQRRGWETVTGFEDYPTPTSGAHASLPKVTDLTQTALLLPATFAKSGGASPLQNVFHSATTDSRAVLTDSLSGGTLASIVADQEMLKDYPSGSKYTKEQGYRFTGIPGWLTQADVLPKKPMKPKEDERLHDFITITASPAAKLYVNCIADETV